MEAELEQMDVPVSQRAYAQKAVSPDYYYRIPVAPIYKRILACFCSAP
jgi:hypothetical protein